MLQGSEQRDLPLDTIVTMHRVQQFLYSLYLILIFWITEW